MPVFEYRCKQELALMLDRTGFQETRAKLIERGQIIWAKAFQPSPVEKRGTD